MDLVANGHHDVRLTRPEYEKLACWIDLLVPFCGDYTEANVWTPEEMRKYIRYAEKRKRMDELEIEAVKAYGR